MQERGFLRLAFACYGGGADEGGDDDDIVTQTP